MKTKKVKFMVKEKKQSEAHKFNTEYDKWVKKGDKRASSYQITKEGSIFLRKQKGIEVVIHKDEAFLTCSTSSINNPQGGDYSPREIENIHKITDLFDEIYGIREGKIEITRRRKS